MSRAKRYHPITMLFDLWAFAKGMVIFAIYLFVIKSQSMSMWIKYGRIAFYAVIVIGLIFIVFSWLTKKYKLDDTSFHLYKGIFSKSERTIPFSKIQNVNRHTSLLHRIFQMTSLHFETGMSGEDATVTFEAISNQEAIEIERYVAGKAHCYNKNNGEIDTVADETLENETPLANDQRTIHFMPTSRDILKASFTSLSFFLLIPVIGSIYFKVDDLFHVEETAESIVNSIVSSWWLVTLVLVFLVIASVIFGMIRTFLKYGKYEISSDKKRIYISKGVIDETAFSIAKDRVQAIEMNQSAIKRILGLAEVKLISAGNLEMEGDKLEVSVLYPFLPVKKAYDLVTEILPSYELTPKMNGLPKKSLVVRMLKPSWLWLFATIGLFYFQPTIGIFGQATWWVISITLLFVILISRILDFYHTRYAIHGQFIQLRDGILTTTLFLTKREKMIEVNVSRSVLQKLFGLSSIGIVNRAQPVHYTGMEDVPVELANRLFSWYAERRNEIVLVDSSEKSHHLFTEEKE